jgi:OOP family OmpA-OmpF porin
MTNKKWIAAVLGAAAMTLSAGALAQQNETGWYVGGSLGQNNDDLDDEMAWKATIGYNINRTFAVEASYAFLGEASESAFGVSASAEATAWEVVGVAKFPVADKFSIYGLLGLAMVEVESEVEFLGVSDSVKDDNTNLTFGLGVQYDFSPKLGVRAQWQDYDDTSVISAGIVYKF